ncbi:MAG: DUF2635 domain-containing protein [Rhodospirillales bacterium]
MKLILKPSSADLVVRDPVTLERLPAAGKSVELSPYWRRRLRSGDVERVKPAAPKKKTDQPEKKET